MRCRLWIVTSLLMASVGCQPEVKYGRRYLTAAGKKHRLQLIDPILADLNANVTIRKPAEAYAEALRFADRWRRDSEHRDYRFTDLPYHTNEGPAYLHIRVSSSTNCILAAELLGPEW